MSRFFIESSLMWLVALVLGVATAFVHPKAPELEKPIDPLAKTVAGVRAMPKDSYLLLDARSGAEFASGHIEGAISLNMEDWTELFGQFLLEHYEPDLVYVVYCSGKGCALSKEIAERLREELPGIEAYFLEGGLPAWKEAQP